MTNKVEINENGGLTFNKELVEVTKKLQIEQNEVEKLLAKIEQLFTKLKESKLKPSDKEAIDEILGRAAYELETCGDESDIRFSKGAITLAQTVIRAY